jgi:hypothetical protein
MVCHKWSKFKRKGWSDCESPLPLPATMQVEVTRVMSPNKSLQGCPRPGHSPLLVGHSHLLSISKDVSVLTHLPQSFCVLGQREEANAQCSAQHPKLVPFEVHWGRPGMVRQTLERSALVMRQPFVLGSASQLSLSSTHRQSHADSTAGWRVKRQLLKAKNNWGGVHLQGASQHVCSHSR